MNKTSTGLQENLAGSLAYLFGFITGIIFLLIEKESRFVRFHAMQSTVVFLSITIISAIGSRLPLIGWIIAFIVSPLSFILWIVLIYKAYNGEYYKLPFVGDIAEGLMSNI